MFTSLQKNNFIALSQARFKDLWKNFNTYTSGEQLLGLRVTKYDCLQKKKYVVALYQQTTLINTVFIYVYVCVCV